MKFLIDENIRKEVITFIESQKYDVIRVPIGSKDSEIAKIAQKEKRIILTHDVHFANIFIYPPTKFFGIIRIKIHPPTAHTIITALKNLFQKYPLSEIDKKLIILEKDNFRVR